jgi:hypothetical protein
MNAAQKILPAPLNPPLEYQIVMCYSLNLRKYLWGEVERQCGTIAAANSSPGNSAGNLEGESGDGSEITSAYPRQELCRHDPVDRRVEPCR